MIQRKSDMGITPSEMRWQILQRAISRSTERYELKLKNWKDKLAKNQDPGIYPDYPSNDEIFALAEEMKMFVSGPSSVHKEKEKE